MSDDLILAVKAFCPEIFEIYAYHALSRRQPAGAHFAASLLATPAPAARR